MAGLAAAGGATWMEATGCGVCNLDTLVSPGDESTTTSFFRSPPSDFASPPSFSCFPAPGGSISSCKKSSDDLFFYYLKLKVGEAGKQSIGGASMRIELIP